MRTGRRAALALILLAASHPAATERPEPSVPVAVHDSAWHPPTKVDPDDFAAAEDAKVRAVRAAAQGADRETTSGAAVKAPEPPAPTASDGGRSQPPDRTTKPPPLAEDRPPAVPVKRVSAQPLPPPEGISESPPLPGRWISIRLPGSRPPQAASSLARKPSARRSADVPIPGPKPNKPSIGGLVAGAVSKLLAEKGSVAR